MNLNGLSSEQVKARVNAGQVNTLPPKASKTVGEIVKDNTLTLFNLINVVIAVCVFFTGSYKNMLFMGVILSNVAIGIVQELRSKRAVDKLSVITAPNTRVVRDGKEYTIPVEELVLGDIAIIEAGAQICADCVIADGSIEVNEALITGETDPIFKEKGDKLLSGSFAVSGRCYAEVEHVGADNYASKLTIEASKHKKLSSEMMISIKKIIKYMGIIIIPVGAALFSKQYFGLGADLNSAILQTAAAMIGMIPEGLVLLTSIALALGVVRLARQRVLVQELYCIETLARVDVLCLDKTGTLTEGVMKVSHAEFFDDDAKRLIGCTVRASTDTNTTADALRQYFDGADTEPDELRNFSSDRKWSGAFFGKTAIIIGAPEIILSDETTQKRAAELAESGCRVIAAVKCDVFEGYNLPAERKALALITLEDSVRESAPATLEMFRSQGVKICIISGDNPVTVSAAAKKAGVQDADNSIDMSTLPQDADLYDISEKYTIFARVSPAQKRGLIQAMKKHGHTVAMTGDGVNDVLALKESDCSIAMGNGSSAAKQIAYILLMDSDFSKLPGVSAESRRVINNITRSASMFLVKTTYSLLLSLIFLVIDAEYPLQPIQLTLVGSLTVGIPSFLLALEPSFEPIRGNFIKNVLYKALPGAFTIVLFISVFTAFAGPLGISDTELSALCAYAIAISGFAILAKVCYPFNFLRAAMCIALICVFTFAALVLDGMFMTTITANMLKFIIPTIVLAIPVLMAFYYVVGRIFGINNVEKNKTMV